MTSSDEPAGPRPARQRRPMTPLQRIAMGAVLVALDTSSRYDFYPDPLGWLLILWGVWALGIPERGTLVTSAGVALAASAVLWFPAPQQLVADEGLALVWAVQLPDLAFVVLLARALITGARAQQPVDRNVAARFGLALWAAVAATVLVPIGFAADSDRIVIAADAVFVLLWIWVVWNLFAVHARPWLAKRRTEAT